MSRRCPGRNRAAEKGAQKVASAAVNREVGCRGELQTDADGPAP